MAWSRSASATTASASPRSSSSASSAATSATRRRRARSSAPALAWPSPARSSRCTAARSGSTARSATAPTSTSPCPSPPSRTSPHRPRPGPPKPSSATIVARCVYRAARGGGSVLHVGTDQGPELVELLQRRLAAVRGHVPDEPFDAGSGAAFDLLRVRFRVVRHRDGLSPCRVCHPLQLGDALYDVATVGHPAVGVADHALEDPRPAATEDDRRVRLLHRLGVGPHRAEVDHLAVVLRRVAGPDRLDRLGALAQELPAPGEVSHLVCHLLAVPAGAAPEDQTAGVDCVATW